MAAVINSDIKSFVKLRTIIYKRISQADSSLRLFEMFFNFILINNLCKLEFYILA